MKVLTSKGLCRFHTQLCLASNISQNNNFYWNVVDSGTRNELLKIFDDFNDGQACVRIVDYLETN